MTDDDGHDWLERLAELWRRERRAHEERFAVETETRDQRERVEAGIALRRLLVDEIDTTAGGRLLVWLRPRKPAQLSGLRLGVGEPLRLWRDDGPEAARATLARRQADRVAVIADEELPDELAEGELHLDRDLPRATFDRGDQAIARVRRLPARDPWAPLAEVLCGRRPPRPPAIGDATRPEPLDDALDQVQRDAVAAALGARELALVHGPPGTGKTRTLVEVIRQLARRGDRVLATAASNTAVDNLAERLAAHGVGVVRLGHPARVAPAVEERSLDALLRQHPDTALARRWMNEAGALRRDATSRRGRGGLDRGAFREAMREARRLVADARTLVAHAQEGIVRRAEVVCATAAGADAAVLGDTAFDWVVVDEATQAPDPIALVALARAPRAVLAGDQHQLPPTVVDPGAARAGLATTFFERVIAAAPEAARMLVVQHRMHSDIMVFPSRSKYQGRLRAAPAVAAHALGDLGVADDPLRPGPLVFVDAAGKGWSEERGADDASLRNPGQAERVAAEVRRLLGRGLPPASLAVIATYRAQVRLLSELLADAIAAGVEISTVDAFQGREKEAVVVDMVRSNDAGEIGFLADTRRINVALTRARRFLLVIGDSATIGAHPYYADFLAHVEASGAWLSAWADDAPPFADD